MGLLFRVRELGSFPGLGVGVNMMQLWVCGLFVLAAWILLSVVCCGLFGLWWL